MSFPLPHFIERLLQVIRTWGAQCGHRSSFDSPPLFTPMGLLHSHHTPAACNWPGPSSEEKPTRTRPLFAMPCMRPSLLRLLSRMDQVARPRARAHGTRTVVADLQRAGTGRGVALHLVLVTHVDDEGRARDPRRRLSRGSRIRARVVVWSPRCGGVLAGHRRLERRLLRLRIEQLGREGLEAVADDVWTFESESRYSA